MYWNRLAISELTNFPERIIVVDPLVLLCLDPLQLTADNCQYVQRFPQAAEDSFTKVTPFPGGPLQLLIDELL